MVAIWYFIGPRPDPTQGQPNLFLGNYETAAEVTQILTPRSMTTEREFIAPQHDRAQAEPITPDARAEEIIIRPAFLPDFPVPAEDVDSTSAFPTFPGSTQDANEWWESTLTFGASRGASAPHICQYS